jgi:DNA-3-methyladenine glycosylase I
MINYEDIFAKVEHALKTQSKHSEHLEIFKNYQDRHLTDSEYFDLLTAIVFYSGFRAETVTKKMDIIKGHFPSYNVVALYDEKKISEIMNDKLMIKNERKIRGCIKNAQVFDDIIKKHGSFAGYVNAFKPAGSFEDLMLFKEEVAWKFDYLGGITAYHFLTDIGLPVLKPDRVITRIFKRIGLIESEDQLLKTVIQGRKFAQVTRQPERYIDMVFVKYGQMGEEKELGLDDGICLEKKPKCNLCGIVEYCRYEMKA